MLRRELAWRLPLAPRAGPPHERDARSRRLAARHRARARGPGDRRGTDAAPVAPPAGLPSPPPPPRGGAPRACPVGLAALDVDAGAGRAPAGLDGAVGRPDRGGHDDRRRPPLRPPAD